MQANKTLLLLGCEQDFKGPMPRTIRSLLADRQRHALHCGKFAGKLLVWLQIAGTHQHELSPIIGFLAKADRALMQV